MKTTNIEIYNFLNLTSPRFGKLYKYTGYSPLPADFVVTKEKIKEKLILSQMKSEDIFPPFIYEDKKEIKKILKKSQKNLKKIEKIDLKSKKFSKEFVEKLEIYLDMRAELTQMLLKDFKNHSFDEVASYREIFNIDPVMSEFFEDVFEDGVNFDSIFENLEEKYKTSYLEKLQKLEKIQNKKKEKVAQENNLQNLKKKEKEKENLQKIGKKVEKIAKNSKKIENKQEIQKIKAEIKKNNGEKINNKNNEKNKEKS